jgi:hypothetical protein
MEDKMRPDANIHQIGPVCRFGPGGDFVRPWPGSKQYLQNADNPLSRLLSKISTIIGTLENQRQYADVTANKGTIDAKQMQDAPAPDTATTATSKSDSDLCGQTLLFADDYRISQPAKPKPKHHIRAHRRTAKKAVTCQLSTQGSLFETHVQSAKTA